MNDCGNAHSGAVIQAITSMILVLLLDLWEMGNIMAERRSKEMTTRMKPER